MTSPLWARLGFWRLTRNPVSRQVYEWIERAGVVLAQLDRFEREATTRVDGPDLPAGVTLSTARASETLPQHLAGEPVAPDDTIVRARRDGETIGCCCLSDRPVYVPELHQRVSLDGTYLWHLYVRPPERGRGIGSAIIAAAVMESAATSDRIVALVAPDNRPSRRAFRRLGFRPTERFTAAGWRSFHRVRRRPLSEPTID